MLHRLLIVRRIKNKLPMKFISLDIIKEEFTSKHKGLL